MSIELYAKRVGQGPAVILLHGLFGSGANLGALSRSLKETYAVSSLDLPNHGRSGWLKSPDLPGMADAVCDWMEAQGLSSAHLVGHSLGGKVAMQLALAQPEKVASLVVADIAPVSYGGHHDAVFAALAAVAEGPCDTRQQAAALMAMHLQEEEVIQFLLASLARDERGELAWRFDVTGIRAAYPALSAAPQGEQSYPGPVLFVRGGNSDYIQQRHWPVITSLFPAAVMTEMPDCGHWLHAEQPALFNSIVGRFLVASKHSKLVPGPQDKRD